jgi:hypothetical protein
MPLAVARAAFSHHDWIFELKWQKARSYGIIRLHCASDGHLPNLRKYWTTTDLRCTALYLR